MYVNVSTNVFVCKLAYLCVKEERAVDHETLQKLERGSRGRWKEQKEMRGPKWRQTVKNRSWQAVKESMAVKRTGGGCYGYFSAQPW